MKKSLIIGLLALTGASLTSCDHLLNSDRFPLDQQTNNPNFWNNETNVLQQCNQIYTNFAGYGNGAGRNASVYFSSTSDDQTNYYGTSPTDFARWIYQSVPTSNSVWSASYVEIRRCNLILQGLETSSLPTSTINNYKGWARLNRALQYFELVRAFGDVPLVEAVLEPESEELYAPRNNRNEVMDYALADYNFAIANISNESSKTTVSKDLARAMKCQACLYEAAYAKYHQNDNARAEKYYNEVVTSAGEILNSHRYEICDDYQSLYNSYGAQLQQNPEIIFFKNYATGILGHSLVKYLSTTVQIMGMNKDAFDSYLFLDGKPLASTGLDKNDAGVLVGTGDEVHIDISGPLAVRDKRLAQTIDNFVCYASQQWKRNNSDWLASTTGYAIKKYINPKMDFQIATYDGANDTAAPIFWLAKICLDYAEAKAELGTLTDADLNLTLNKLYKRAGLPTQTVAGLQAINDPANNMNVSSLIWEIRRCRRCELMFDGMRYWDLNRWKQFELMDTNKHPNISLGANLKNIPAENKEDLYFTNGYINVAQTANGRMERVYNEREYLYPIGSQQIVLNPNLKQNPGWN